MAVDAFEKGGWGSRILPSVVFVRWPVVCDGFREGRFGIVDDMKTAGLLIIDDLGAESDQYKSKVHVDQLCQVMSRREFAFSIISTNIDPDKWVEMFDVRVHDRFNRNSVLPNLDGIPSFQTV
jgi:DNA replication protein DnaC